MTEQATPRRCGNCGEQVAAGDIICPHCDALLAAYEAPSGATAGTPAAVDPIQISAEPLSSSTTELPATSSPEPQAPYVSPTAQSLDALDAQKPHASATSTTFDLPQASPVSEALERTRATANLEPASAPPAESEARSEPLSQPSEHDDGRQSTVVERVRARANDEQSDDSLIVRRISHQATSAEPDRPAPERRAKVRAQPVRTSSTQQGQALSGGKSSLNIGPFVGLIVIAIIVLRIVGLGAIAGFLVLPLAIAALVWFMAAVARNTGRKTTSMPKDKRPWT